MDINEFFKSDMFKTALADGEFLLISKETTREQVDNHFKEQVELNNSVYEYFKGHVLAQMEGYPSSVHNEKVTSLITIVFENIGELNSLDTNYSKVLHKIHALQHGSDIEHLDFLIQEVFYLNSCLKPMYAKLNLLVNKINRKRDEPLKPSIIEHDASNIEYFKDLVDEKATAQGSVSDKIKIASVLFFDILDRLYSLEIDKVSLLLEKDVVYNAKPSMQIYTLVDCFASLQPNKHYTAKKLEILGIEMESHTNFRAEAIKEWVRDIKANR